MMTETCGPNTWKMEVGGAGVQFSLSYTVNLKPAWAMPNPVSKKYKGRKK